LNPKILKKPVSIHSMPWMDTGFSDSEYVLKHPEGISPRSLLCQPGSVLFSFQNICDSLACMAIPIGINSLAHFTVFFFILQQFLKRAINRFFIRSNQFECSCIYAFRPFCCVSHHKNRHTVRRALLLNSAGISQAEKRPCLKVVAVKDLDGFDDMTTGFMWMGYTALHSGCSSSTRRMARNI